ncbi:MAG: TolC family outer membrane protein [Pseudomonadota bacterium]
MNRARTFGRAAALMFGMVALAPLAGPASGQTLSDALVAAYQSNPDLVIGRAQLRQADEQVVQAQSELLPDVTGTVTGTASNREAVFLDGGVSTVGLLRPSLSADATITGTVTLYSFGRNPANIASAVASVLSARASLISVEQDVLLDAATAFLDVRRDLQFVSLARNNVRVNSELLRATQDRFEVGEVTRTDVAQAEAALASARSNLASNTGSLSESRAQFLAVIGFEAVDLAPPPPAPDLPKALAEAETIAMREHPDLISSRFSEEAAMQDVELARSGLNPVITLSTSVFYQASVVVDRGNESDSTGADIQLQLQVPLYQGGELSSLIREAIALLDQRKGETQRTGRLIRQQVQTAWSQLSVARASIAANGEEVRAEQVAFEGVVEEARFGERTTLDVLEAEQSLLEARSNLVSALRDANVAAYSLLSAMGLLTVSHLGLGVEPYDPTENYDFVTTNPPDPEGLRLERILDRWGD